MTAPMTAEGELGEATPMLAAAPAAFTAPSPPTRLSTTSSARRSRPG